MLTCRIRLEPCLCSFTEPVVCEGQKNSICDNNNFNMVILKRYLHIWQRLWGCRCSSAEIWRTGVAWSQIPALPSRSARQAFLSLYTLVPSILDVFWGQLWANHFHLQVYGCEFKLTCTMHRSLPQKKDSTMSERYHESLLVGWVAEAALSSSMRQVGVQVVRSSGHAADKQCAIIPTKILIILPQFMNTVDLWPHVHCTCRDQDHGAEPGAR